jgi:hypothetical protein
VDKQIEKDEEMRTFFEDIGNARGPIDPRDAYFGGNIIPKEIAARLIRKHIHRANRAAEAAGRAGT